LLKICLKKFNKGCGRIPCILSQGVGRKFSNGKKDRKVAKRPKNSTIMLLPGDGGETEKIAKKRKIALSTIFVPRMKIQEGHSSRLPAADAHVSSIYATAFPQLHIL